MSVAPIVTPSKSAQNVQQRMKSSIIWKNLAAWQNLPGSCVMAETVLRDVCHSQITDRNLAFNAITNALNNLAVQTHSSDVFSSCCANLSLLLAVLASVHKSVRCYSPSLDYAYSRGAPEHSEKYLTQQQLTSTHKLLTAVLKVVLLHPKTDQKITGSDSVQTEPMQRARIRHVTATTGESRPSISSRNGNAGNAVSGAEVLPYFVAGKMHQLQAVVVMILCRSGCLQLCVLEEKKRWAAFVAACADTDA